MGGGGGGLRGVVETDANLKVGICRVIAALLKIKNIRASSKLTNNIRSETY